MLKIIKSTTVFPSLAFLESSHPPFNNILGQTIPYKLLALGRRIWFHLMKYFTSCFIKQNKTHQDEEETQKFSLGWANDKGKWRGTGIFYSFYSLNALRKMCCSTSCLLFFHYFFLLHLIFMVHNYLTLCLNFIKLGFELLVLMNTASQN